MRIYHPHAGEHLDFAAKKLIQYAHEFNEPIAMEFSNIGLIANPGDNYYYIIKRFNKLLKRRKRT